LVATVAEVTADVANEKATQKVKATEKKEATQKKTVENKAKEQENRDKILPQLRLLMEDFVSGRKRIEDFVMFPVQTHKDIIKCYYSQKPKGWTKMSKQELHEVIVKACNDTKAVTAI